MIGVGGIGASAIQGARLAGAEMIFAIDPVELKRTLAPTFGATHSAASVDEAFELIQQETWGRMCDKVICAMGIGQGSMMDSILGLTAKRGRVVVTNIHPMGEMDVTMSLMYLTILEKQVVGSIFGSANIHSDIPKLLKLYREGQLDLDSMITTTYKLGDINQGYQDMRDGKNIRGVLLYDELRDRGACVHAAGTAATDAGPGAGRRTWDRAAGADEPVVRGLLHHVGAPADGTAGRRRSG